MRASIESEQVGSCYYSAANHSFLWVTDWVRQRAADIQKGHCQVWSYPDQTSYLLVGLHPQAFVSEVGQWSSFSLP